MRIRPLVTWQYPGRKGKHLKLFLLLQIFWLSRVGSSIVWSPVGSLSFFLLHGLISVFLLLGRRMKHEKLVFTILDHPVQAQGSLQKKSPIHFTHCTFDTPFFWTMLPWLEYSLSSCFIHLRHKNTSSLDIASCLNLHAGK